MKDLHIKRLEKELDQIYSIHGASKRQRDAFYYGYVAGVEISNNHQSHEPKTNLLGELETNYPIELETKLNYFFARRGFTTKEKPHFRKGIEWGLIWGME
ncbi:hypothetical protein SMD22_00575 (plasmid) [Brevibacillus halotolerans]|nr:hypothetical protein SMD22_00575 [Brevibacillus halotolerans]